MKYIVRRLVPCELDEALQLAWSTYMEFEAPDWGLCSNGTETAMGMPLFVNVFNKSTAILLINNLRI